MTMEEPSFGVQAGPSSVVRDLDRAEFAEGVESFDVGGAHIGGGKDSQLATLFHEPGQGVSQQSEAAPFEKSAEQVNAVGGLEFFDQLGADAVFASGVDQQIR